MTLTRPAIMNLLLFTTSLASLNGCTVLGVVADNAIFHEHERNRPLMEQDQIQPQETLFSTLGMEADILIAKKIIATVKGEPEAAPKRCVMENGIRICFEQGAEGY